MHFNGYNFFTSCFLFAVMLLFACATVDAVACRFLSLRLCGTVFSVQRMQGVSVVCIFRKLAFC